MVRALDPTQTLTLRNQAVREVDKRFAEIARVIRVTIVDNNILANAEAADAGRFVFLRDAQKVEEFRLWLKAQLDAEILGTLTPQGAVVPTTQGSRATNWLNVFIGIAYNRGATKTRRRARRRFPALVTNADNVLANPAHIRRAELIFTRVFSQLEGVVGEVEQQVTRVLTDGIIRGDTTEQISRNLVERTEVIGRTRARLIARTEIVNSHNSAAIIEADELEGVLGEPVQMIWQTSLDGRERDVHRGRHMRIYDRDQAQRLIGEPNCRCSITPWVEEFGEL